MFHEIQEAYDASVAALLKVEAEAEAKNVGGMQSFDHPKAVVGDMERRLRLICRNLKIVRDHCIEYLQETCNASDN